MNEPSRRPAIFSSSICGYSISWRGGLDGGIENGKGRNGDWVRLIALEMIRFRYGTGTRAVVVVVPARLRKMALLGWKRMELD